MNLRDEMALAILGTSNVGGVPGIDPKAAADRVLVLLVERGEPVEYDSADDAYARQNRWETEEPGFVNPWVIDLGERTA